MTVQRDPNFDREYWERALDAVREDGARAREASLKEPSALAVPVAVLGAAGAAPRALLAELCVLYSKGASRDDMLETYERLLPAHERLVEVSGQVPSRLALRDVGARRDVYDTALGTMSWAVLLDLTPPSLDLWQRGDEDALLLRVARHDRTDDVALLWPKTFGPLMDAMLSRPAGAGPALEAFLRNWLRTSRRSSWWGSLQEAQRNPEDAAYHGYWAFEAAAVVELLGLDDSSFRDAPYYPADLVSGR